MGNEGVIAVEKALALLDCFRPGDDSLTLTALSQASGYHKTTVYRLMNSLERMNYACCIWASCMSNLSIWPAWYSPSCNNWRWLPMRVLVGM